MKTLGIVGGIAPPSTIEYYRAVVEIHRTLASGRPPRVLISSLDGDEVLGHLARRQTSKLVTALLAGLHELAAGGASLALFASSSVHVVFDSVRDASPLPLIGIADATAASVSRFKRLGLLATGFTVDAGVFAGPLRTRGVALVAPTTDEQHEIDRIYFDELVVGKIQAESRERIQAIADRLRAEHDVGGILLGGTELSLLLPFDTHGGFPYLDTARLHAEAAVAAMLA